MKEQEVRKTEKTKKKTKKKTDWLGSIGLTLILTAIVLIICFFLNGGTTVTGELTGGTRYSSLSCSAEGIIYPFFEFDETTNEKTEVKVLFGEGGMKSISLTQTMYYPDLGTSKASEAHNHAAMNISFGELGYKADAFEANYSVQEDKMIMTLYATEANFDDVSARYFLAKGMDEASTIDDFTKVFNDQGLNCVISK